MAEPTTSAGVVLVTGAAGTIGRALLRRFTADGWRTVATDLAPASNAEEGPANLWVAADVTRASDMAAAVQAATDRFGRLDVVVANAGVTALGTFDDTADDAFVRVMDVNLHGAVHTLRAALPALRSSRGTVVAVSSVAGFAPVLGRPAYAASKHAVTGLFRSLRPELARDGVGVTIVYPSFLATAPADQVHRVDGDGRRTTGRPITPDDVARAVVDAVRRRRGEVFVGRLSKVSDVVQRLSPRLYTRLMERRLG